MTCKVSRGLACLAALLALGGVTPLRAALVVGGSTLLSGGDANQLETWLGEGPVTLTKIYSKSGDGSTSIAFHNAANGMGRTFSVIQVLLGNGYSPQVIGGYNPQSWSSSSGYHLTPANSNRTAFIFNLTSAEKQAQRLSDSNGHYQTYNLSSYGPTFGAGHDIYVDSNLTGGYAYNYSYGLVANDNIIGGAPNLYSYNLLFGEIEVFTITDGIVPEPSSLMLASCGALSLVVLGIRRRYRA